MNGKVKKVVVLGLAAVMAFSAAACGQKDAAQDEGGRTKVSFAAWVSGPIDNNSWLETKLEEIFPDIDLEILAFERDTFMDQLNTRIAGGDIPDIIYRYERTDVENLVRMGVLTEVPFDMIKQNMPKYLEATKSFGADVWMACNVDDKNYGVPYMQMDMKNGNSTNAWRMDWLRNVGIDKVPETLEEMEEALRRFVYNDPDGNGQDDTYGIISEGKSLGAQQCFSAVYMAYGVSPAHWFLQDDGSVKYGIVTDEAKEALKTINRWYEEGLIDPEYVVSDGKTKREKWANGKGGYVDCCTWTRLVPPDSEFYSALMGANPDAEIALAPAPKGPDGEYGYPGFGGITSSVVFGSQLKDDQPKLERILQMIEKIGTDKEVNLLMSGQEGVHWNWDDGISAKVYVDEYSEAKLRGPLGTNFLHFANFGIPDLNPEYNRKDYDEVSKYARDHSVTEGEDYFPVVRLLIPSDVLQSTQDTQNVAAKWEVNFVTGVNDIDQDWDTFVAEWEAAGGKQLTEAANAAYVQANQSIENINNQLN